MTIDIKAVRISNTYPIISTKILASASEKKQKNDHKHLPNELRSKILSFLSNPYTALITLETKGKTVFYYSDPEIIVTPPEFNPDLPDKELMFQLPQVDYQQLLQAAKVYGVEDLCINGFGFNEYSICVRDNKNKTSNVFSLPLKNVVFDQGPRNTGEGNYTLTPERQNFCYCFKVENLKLIDASYHVTISNKNIACFTSTSQSEQNYFIAMEPK